MSNVQKGYWREKWLNPHNENSIVVFLSLCLAIFDDLDINNNCVSLSADESLQVMKLM
jgi:hypothetical protein